MELFKDCKKLWEAIIPFLKKNALFDWVGKCGERLKAGIIITDRPIIVKNILWILVTYELLKYSLSIALLSVIDMTGQELKTEVLDAYKSIDSLIDL